MITDFTIRAKTSLNNAIIMKECFSHFKELGFVPNWRSRSPLSQRLIDVNLHGKNIKIYECKFDIDIVRFN